MLYNNSFKRKEKNRIAIPIPTMVILHQFIYIIKNKEKFNG